MKRPIFLNLRTLGIALAAVVASIGPRTAWAKSNDTTVSVKAALARARIPAWARKYNTNCNYCHYPVVPRLNATGLTFKWAGFRMPDDIGKKEEVKRLEDYISARGILQYVYSKTDGQPADSNTMVVPSASIFLGGALGTNYSVFLEFERTPDASIDLVGEVSGVWGKEKAFGGLRAGQGHMIFGGALAGFDRPTGILAPLALSAQATPGVPFSFTGDVAAVEAYYVLGGRNRLAVQYVNGLMSGGEGMATTTSTTAHDFSVSDQFLWDDVGSGVTAVAYFGSVAGLDTTQASLSSNYARLGLSANKFFGPIEAQGGYVYATNSRLPVSAASPFRSSSVSGNGYWIYGGYTKGGNAGKSDHWTLYGRYEFLNPDNGASSLGTQRVVLGGVVPFNVPEYFRVAMEYFIDTPRAAGAVNRQGLTAQFHVAF